MIAIYYFQHNILVHNTGTSKFLVKFDKHLIYLWLAFDMTTQNIL